jgi:site-specific DNA-cytosine methylase
VKRPRAFLLEKVKGLTSKRHQQVLENIINRLRRIADGAYKVGFRVLDTADHGLPQHRERLYIVGMKRCCLVREACFKWPSPSICLPLPSVLGWGPVDKRKALKREAKFLSKSPASLGQRLASALRRIAMKGLDPRDPHRPIVVDIDGSVAHWMRGVSPCLTRARASTGHYLPALGRRLTIHEHLRLQGLPVTIHKLCRDHVSERQLGSMIGNSLSLNVIRKLLSKMLPACGLMGLKKSGCKIRCRPESKQL